VQFRNQLAASLSVTFSGDFYDKDGSGFLEYTELERFLR
jgi:hypothetical protein